MLHTHERFNLLKFVKYLEVLRLQVQLRYKYNDLLFSKQEPHRDISVAVLPKLEWTLLLVMSESWASYSSLNFGLSTITVYDIISITKVSWAGIPESARKDIYHISVSVVHYFNFPVWSCIQILLFALVKHLDIDFCHVVLRAFQFLLKFKPQSEMWYFLRYLPTPAPWSKSTCIWQHQRWAPWWVVSD